MYYQEGINNDNEIQLFKKLNSTFPLLNITKITTLKKDGEAINGHSFADLKVRKNVSYSILFETFDGRIQNNPFDDKNCFKLFNPLTPEHLEKAKKLWSDAINLVINQVIGFLDTEKSKWWYSYSSYLFYLIKIILIIRMAEL